MRKTYKNSLCTMLSLLIMVFFVGVMVLPQPASAAVVNGKGVKRELDTARGTVVVDSLEGDPEEYNAPVSNTAAGPAESAPRPSSTPTQKHPNMSNMPTAPVETTEVPTQAPKSNKTLKYIILGIVITLLGLGAVIAYSKKQEE